ncbi:flagellar assembly protein FliW [Paenibacillus rigui]|uniref:Flagellar assembly factor FliW n=1 Tax=Paenibacillus rigui TaxID=554312 RepID=A0A229USH8_9BACL|nr:flagellar assembly protein FliW [Paenibacillus rigui]OXM86362.1 flagellar assembly protein FliW [Paenibacillus rigui]
MLNLLHNKTISFQGSLLGFSECDKFHFSLVDEDGFYGFIQSESEQSLGFVVVNPFIFYKDYAFEVEESVKKVLNLESPDDTIVLSIVTIHEHFQRSTMNLLAPLVININNNVGRQIVLPPKTAYGTKEPLFQQTQVGKGELG